MRARQAPSHSQLCSRPPTADSTPQQRTRFTDAHACKLQPAVAPQARAAVTQAAAAKHSPLPSVQLFQDASSAPSVGQEDDDSAEAPSGLVTNRLRPFSAPVARSKALQRDKNRPPGHIRKETRFAPYLRGNALGGPARPLRGCRSGCDGAKLGTCSKLGADVVAGSIRAGIVKPPTHEQADKPQAPVTSKLQHVRHDLEHSGLGLDADSILAHWA